MNLSYWEIRSWLAQVDFTIVGSGIVGLTAAIAVKERSPNANVLVLERGMLPQGASTKNAGFACFGSLSEILDDLNTHTGPEVLQLIEKRWKGLQELRKLLSDKAIEFQQNGGYELFCQKNEELYEECLEKLPKINELLFPLFQQEVFSVKENRFGFEKVQPKLIWNALEGQLDTGMMMIRLLQKAQVLGIKILNRVIVEEYVEGKGEVTIKTNHFEMNTKKLMIATNGFAAQLGITMVKPARAQVLITKPIDNLDVKGTFHLDKGYYYFRNIDNRILLGGGRNLDFKGEETTEMGQTPLIQEQLETLLRDIILPRTPFEIDWRWSGIMGVGHQKRPIIEQLSDHVCCGVRLGGMGVAIGVWVGKELAELVTSPLKGRHRGAYK